MSQNKPLGNYLVKDFRVQTLSNIKIRRKGDWFIYSKHESKQI